MRDLEAMKMHAVCSVCGRVTCGKWLKGREERYPRKHSDAKTGRTCAGTYKIAILRPAQ